MAKRFLFFVLLLAAAKAIATAQDSPAEQFAAYQVQAEKLAQQQDIMAIISVYEKMTELCRQTPELKDELYGSMYNFALYSTYGGNYQQSIDLLVELLELPEIIHATEKETDLLTIKARAEIQFGTACFFLERWDDALVHYLTAKDLALQLDNRHGLSITENNIGNIYQKKGNYVQAIEQYERCIDLQDSIGDEETLCNTCYNLGTCHSELGNWTEAYSFFEKALQTAVKIDEKEILSLCLKEMALYNATKKHDFIKAAEQVSQAENIASQAGFRQVLGEVYNVRSLIEEEKGSADEALAYHKKYKALSDSLFNEKTVNKISEYEIRYKTAEKELEIERQHGVIARQNMLRNGLFTGLGLLTVILGLLWYSLRLRSRRTRELSEMNATKDSFFSIISHDLKGPAVSQREALQILLDGAESWDAALLKDYYRELLRSADGQVELLYNLLNWAQVQTGRMPYYPRPFNLIAELHNDLALMRSMAERKGVVLKFSMPGDALVTGDANMLLTVVRNLTTNAIKFTPQGRAVTLAIAPYAAGTGNAPSMPRTSGNRAYTVTVSDEGVGMTAEQLHNLFRIDTRRSHRGTAGETGSGLGLIVCKELLEKHGCTLHVETETGQGSRFWFVI
jgi:signal transduction histidine kinase